MLGVTDGIRDCVWLAVPQPTEWQHIGNQLNAAMVFARADLVNCVVSWSSERSVVVSGGAVSSWDWTWSCAMWRWRSSVNNRAGAEVISPATDRLGEAEGGARPRGLHGV